MSGHQSDRKSRSAELSKETEDCLEAKYKELEDN